MTESLVPLVTKISELEAKLGQAMDEVGDKQRTMEKLNRDTKLKTEVISRDLESVKMLDQSQDEAKSNLLTKLEFLELNLNEMRNELQATANARKEDNLMLRRLQTKVEYYSKEL